MGLTKNSVGRFAIDRKTNLRQRSPDDRTVALAGNPNVGKSTLFNTLTGMHQHTGNWPGKTVTGAQGYCAGRKRGYVLVDIPGTYSLLSHSVEEEVARDFLCAGEADAVVVVCDATCLERSLRLVLQITEVCPRILVCVNLMDEAKRRGIHIDIARLSKALGLPCVATTGTDRHAARKLTDALDALFETSKEGATVGVAYPPAVTEGVARLTPFLQRRQETASCARFLALRLLAGGRTAGSLPCATAVTALLDDADFCTATEEAQEALRAAGITAENYEDILVSTLSETAREICRTAEAAPAAAYGPRARRADRFLTGRLTGYPVMLLLLALVFFLTVTVANYPSSLLSLGFSKLEEWLRALFIGWQMPSALIGLLLDGAFRVTAWVVSVMLPPMAIFFPLFTLLEDAGYLPRVAYNLDAPFRRCGSCGKQALSMCMGFGCNAAGVTGCRIIDSPRERLLSILTNSFVPCNGRFPTLLALISIFFVGQSVGLFPSLLSAGMLTLLILLGVFMTLLTTRLLSATLLRGHPSSFALEMPPFRRPQIRQVLVRSLFDRTVFVLGRAVAVAAPTGMLLWLLANITVGGESVLAHTATFLDPVAAPFGLDGVILLAFILGSPANEIVLPIALMIYTSGNSLQEVSGYAEMQAILTANGWGPLTALCVMLFSLLHWPCTTTCLTVKKETGSLRYTLLAAVLPTVAGLLLCLLVNAVGRTLLL